MQFSDYDSDEDYPDILEGKRGNFMMQCEHQIWDGNSQCPHDDCSGYERVFVERQLPSRKRLRRNMLLLRGVVRSTCGLARARLRAAKRVYRPGEAGCRECEEDFDARRGRPPAQAKRAKREAN